MHCDSHHHHGLNKKAIILPIVVSFLLVGIKTYGWFVTDSVSLLSSLLDSSLDIIISVINMMAVLYAVKPADNDHRFGHNAIEDIVGLIQAAFIAATGMFIVYEATRHFAYPHPVKNPETGIWVLALSIAGALIIVLYQKWVVYRTKSLVVEADSLHYLSDLLVNLAIMASIYIAAMPGWEIVDPIVGSLIAIYVLRASYKIGIRAFDHLMDKELLDKEREKLIELMMAEEGVKGYHELKTRRSGSRAFVQLHIEIDKRLNFQDAHDIADKVEKKLIEFLGDAEVMVHMDPV